MSSSQEVQRRAVNAYGSFVAEESNLQDEEMQSLDDLAVPRDAVENRITCRCKNTCRRKSGRTRGCTCRDSGLPCPISCDCGPEGKPCSNRKETCSNTPADIARLPASAFDRHQEAAAKSRDEIGAFIQTITPEERDRLLLELLSNGRGSLDYAKNLLQGSSSDPNPEVPPNTGQPEWCICGVCRPMTTLEENKCCRKRVCVTSYELFQNICIDREVLTVAIRARCDIRVEEPDYASNSLRKAAYRQYILWRFGKLGRGNRKACPACVVGVKREAYSALDGQYLGFRRS